MNPPPGPSAPERPDEPPQYEDELFEELAEPPPEFTGASFLDCRFVACTFPEADLTGSRFLRCRFDACDLSLVTVTDAVFTEAAFHHCQLVGVNWAVAANTLTDPLALELHDCVLDHATLMHCNLSGRSLRNCLVREAYFADVDLRGADLRGSNFRATQFVNCDLRDADLRGAADYAIDVTRNKVAGAKVALPEALALLTGLGLELS